MEEGTHLFLTSFYKTQDWEDSLAEAAATISQKYKVKLQKVHDDLDSIVPSEEELNEALPRGYDAWRTTNPAYENESEYEREAERVYLNFDLGSFLASDYADDFDYKGISANETNPKTGEPYYHTDDKTYPASYIVSSLAGYLSSQTDMDGLDLQDEAKQLFTEQVAEALQKAGYTLQLDLSEEIDMGNRTDAVKHVIRVFEAYTKRPRITSKEDIIKELSNKISNNYSGIPADWLFEKVMEELEKKDS